MKSARRSSNLAHFELYSPAVTSSEMHPYQAVD
jgi:hypothetical protein